MRGGSSELNIDGDNSLHIQESKFRDELSGLAHLDKSGLVRKEDGNQELEGKVESDSQDHHIDGTIKQVGMLETRTDRATSSEMKCL